MAKAKTKPTPAQTKITVGNVYRDRSNQFYRVVSLGRKYATVNTRFGKFGKFKQAEEKIEKAELADMALWREAA